MNILVVDLFYFNIVVIFFLDKDWIFFMGWFMGFFFRIMVFRVLIVEKKIYLK